MSEFLTDGLPGWPGWRADRADHFYTLRTYGTAGGDADYHTGALPDGRRGVMGLWGRDTLVCLLFAPDGTPVEVLTLPVPPVPESEAADLSRWDRDFGWGRKQAVVWQQDLGWAPAPIRVRRFMHALNPIYISDYPRWAIRYLADPLFTYPEPEEREAVARDLAEWEASGRFVFWWGKDYYVGPDGEVVAT